MDKIIQNQPNNMITILCGVKIIDSDRNNYAIIPQSVCFGHLDDENNFIPETEDTKYIDVSRFEESYKSEDDLYYLYPIEISELQKRYNNIDTSTQLAIVYFRDIRDKILLLYKTKTGDSPVIESVIKRDPCELKELNEDIQKRYLDVFAKKKAVADSKRSELDNDLASIKRVELANYLKERIINNDSLMDDIATVIVANFRTNNPKLVKNIMCVGPTGCGKTETFRLIAEYANIPITVIDSNQLTAEGFVGKGVDDVLKQIYAVSGNNIEKAERSILMFDEVDKIAARGDLIKDLDVQQALLKVLEGYKFSFENKRGSGQLQLDTSFITKVGSGAFMDLFDKRKQKHSLGFNQVDEVLAEKKLVDKDIINYGFLPEFVGRFPLIYTYNPLDESGLKTLLTRSKISPLVQIKERLQEEFGCTIEYDDAFLEEVIQAALETEAGGRSLSKIISQSFIKLEGAMIDEVDLGHSLPKTLKLNKAMVKDPTNFNL